MKKKFDGTESPDILFKTISALNSADDKLNFFGMIINEYCDITGEIEAHFTIPIPYMEANVLGDIDKSSQVPDGSDDDKKILSRIWIPFLILIYKRDPELWNTIVLATKKHRFTKGGGGCASILLAIIILTSIA